MSMDFKVVDQSWEESFILHSELIQALNARSSCWVNLRIWKSKAYFIESSTTLNLPCKPLTPWYPMWLTTLDVSMTMALMTSIRQRLQEFGPAVPTKVTFNADPITLLSQITTSLASWRMKVWSFFLTSEISMTAEQNFPKKHRGGDFWQTATPNQEYLVTLLRNWTPWKTIKDFFEI